MVVSGGCGSSSNAAGGGVIVSGGCGSGGSSYICSGSSISCNA